ncbi:LPS export ABC transporter permease LptG [Sulfuriferula sp.]|uniref:LPS export ABC transporter permease LptG n=1 Tax=Sulfuriferula sp. TaxID=2025307 RepID=UPI0027321825|nr:LPS export ABC transporter permease LptG [Sulfuriferula sp.]MDP2025417.1 LPS export ABC transporter permease LptG [Sulfuriferula sp.]
MKILPRYLASEVLLNTLFVFTALVTLFAFFDLIQELGSLKGGYGLLNILAFVGLSLPGHIYDLLPVAALIGTIFALSRLVANSEFTIMLVSGVSMAKMALYLMLVGLLFALLTFTFGEFVAPASERYAQQSKLKATNRLVAQSFRSGLWVRDGQDFINIREVTPDIQLRDINIYEFDTDFRLQTIRHAERGDYQRNNQWKLTGITDTRFSGGDVNVTQAPDTLWRSVLTPGVMSVLLIAPEKMSAGNLWSYIEHLRKNKQTAERYEIALWSKLFYPLAAPVMMLLALPFAYHRPRAGGVSARILGGIMVGLGYHLLNRLFAYLGLLNDWPPLFSASLPTLLFLILAVVLIRKAQRQ